MDQTTPAMHTSQHEMHGFATPITVIIFIVAIILGTGVGYVIAGGSPSGGSMSPTKMIGLKNPAKTAGENDPKKFPDKAEGTLREGGIEGEGNFHVERKGGESQNVYVTSSNVDLSEYIGKKVRVHGQTFEGEKAGWLMDVGYIEIL